MVSLLALAPVDAHAQDDDAPRFPPGSDPLRALMEAADIDWTSVDAPAPRGARKVVIGREAFSVSQDGRTFWTDDPDMGPSRVAARGALRPGAKLVPAVDLWAVEEMASPTGWALLVPGWAWAWTSDGPFVLERAPIAGVPAPGPSVPNRAAVAETVAVRGMRTCPSGRGPCLLYGPLADVVAAEDPRHPLWGYVLEPRAAPPLPAQAPIHREVARQGDVAIEVDEYPVAGDAWAEQPQRVWLVMGSRRVHAFDAAFLQGLEPTWEIVRYGGDLVVLANASYRIALSRHDPRTGARRGPATRVEAVAYYHDCDDSQWLEPVLTAHGTGFVLVFADDEGQAAYWPSPTSRGRFVPVRAPAEGDYGEVVRYTFEGNGLRPVGR